MMLSPSFCAALTTTLALFSVTYATPSLPVPTKEVQPYLAQRMTFTSKSNVTSLMATLEKEVRADLDGQYLKVIAAPIAARNRTAFEEAVTGLLGPTGFMYFGVHVFDRWMFLYEDSAPVMRAYSIGNPIIAQSMTVYDSSTPLHVPLNLMVIGGANVTTRVVYDLPSSVVAIGGPLKDKKLYDAAKLLDDKLEIMARKITGN